MEVLGDDEMLLVLGYLPAEDLLVIRGVCRRWRDLALHADLWRRHSLDIWWAWDRTQEKLKHRAILRLAPCLNRLTLQSSAGLDYCGVLAASSPCAVRALSMDLRDKDSAVVATLVLQHQVALGRLESLDLFVRPAAVDSASFSDLVSLAVTTEGLQYLSVVYQDGARFKEGELAVTYSPPPAQSLKTLGYCSPSTDPVLRFLLQTHAQTLEEVYLSDMGHCKELATLLVTVPNLRKLTCPLLDNLQRLLQCRQLVRLTLKMGMSESVDSGHALAGAEGLLRDAKHLTKLALIYDPNQAGREVDLLLSTVESGPSALTSIKVWVNPNDGRFDDGEPALQCAALVRALPRLPNLKTLKLENAIPSADLFLAIRPATAPRLSLLEVDQWTACHHQQVHRADVQDMLRLNPRLRITVKGCTCPDLVEEGEPLCQFCQVGCHPELHLLSFSQ